jgi:tetratricopeptide (TPR) repeat protein
LPIAESTADPDRARFQLFDGMASLLRTDAETRPLVIVLDDLHAADHSSLVMLQFLARQLRDVPLMLIGCYRDTEIRSGSETDIVLAELARDVHHVGLRGLDEHDIGHFISATGLSPATPSVVSTVHVVTGGNPFFLGEVVGQLATGSAVAGRVPLPDGVREAVRSRLRRLPPDSIELLTLASVFGQQFGLHALATTAGKPLDRVVAALEEASNARLIAESAGALGHYAFFHGLIREVLYEELAAGRRAEFHGRVGTALERLYGTDGDTHLATLAHHFFMASPHGDSEKAIDFCTRAGARALGVFAAPEAVEHYGRALQVLSLTGDDMRKRCKLLLGRGRALERAGDFEAARRDFGEAAAIARQVDDAGAFVSAALGCGEQWALKFTSSILDKSELPLLEEALRMTAPAAEDLRATLLARAGSALFYSGAYERGDVVSAQAVALARQGGEADVLARALSARHAVLLGPDGLLERFRVVEEIERIAEVTGNREVGLRGHVLRFYDLVERGDVDAAEAEFVHMARLANEIGDPFEQWHCTLSQAAAAFFRGRIAESGRLARVAYNEAHRVPGQQRAEPNAPLCFVLQLAMVRREQGRLGEIANDFWAMAPKYGQVTTWQVIAALMELDLGRTQEAAARCVHVGTQRLSTMPRDSVWVGTLALAAEVLARLRDPIRSERVLELLRPYADLNATVASLIWLGSTTRALALASGVLGRWDESAAYFEHALEWHRRKGALLWLGHTQVDYAAMLVERGASGDLQQAAGLLEGAQRLGRDLEAMRLATRVEMLARDCHATPTVAPSAVTHPPRALSARALFRREGEYWTVAHGEHTVRLKHSRGMAMLAYLLARPGREIHSTELVSVANPPPVDLPSTLGDGVSRPGEVADRRLDPKARFAYRERLMELRAELEEARAHQDSHRASRTQAEMEQLAAELKRDLGLGGVRKSGSLAERARLNVTRAIRSALARIADSHPVLGEHFRLAVRTGSFCVYEPDPTSTIVWDT